MPDVIAAVESAMRELGEGDAHFAEEQKSQLGIATVASPTPEAAVRGADIVVTVTTSQTPVLETDWVESHALIAAIGSNFRNRAEVPPELVERATTVVVDQLSTAKMESGDLIQAAELGKLDWGTAVKLGSVVAGRWARPEPAGSKLLRARGLA